MLFLPMRHVLIIVWWACWMVFYRYDDSFPPVMASDYIKRGTCWESHPWVCGFLGGNKPEDVQTLISFSLAMFNWRHTDILVGRFDFLSLVIETIYRSYFTVKLCYRLSVSVLFYSLWIKGCLIQSTFFDVKINLMKKKLHRQWVSKFIKNSIN